MIIVKSFKSKPFIGLTKAIGSILQISLLFSVVNLTGCDFANYWVSRNGPSESLYRQGLLALCPDSPNCISTQANDQEHLAIVFTYTQPLPLARAALIETINSISSMTIQKVDAVYLHVEARSQVLHVIDDIEFLFDEPKKLLHFRSSSRFGFTDWGKNKARMEHIRNLLLGKI